MLYLEILFPNGNASMYLFVTKDVCIFPNLNVQLLTLYSMQMQNVSKYNTKYAEIAINRCINGRASPKIYWNHTAYIQKQIIYFKSFFLLHFFSSLVLVLQSNILVRFTLSALISPALIRLYFSDWRCQPENMFWKREEKILYN